MADVGRKCVLDDDGPAQMRKKLRPSELPLSQVKRSAIDNLVHTFRKKGHYDSIRKELLAQYEASVSTDTTSKDIHEPNVVLAARQRRPPVRSEGSSRK
jgi:hypothetical protein